MTNSTEHKPSTVEVIKDKAAHLVSKVTGKSHNNDEVHATNTDPVIAQRQDHTSHHDASHVSHSNAAHDTLQRPDAIHDPNHHSTALAHGVDHIPTHATNTAAPEAAIPSTYHDQHSTGIPTHGQYATGVPTHDQYATGLPTREPHAHHDQPHGAAALVGAAAAAEAAQHHHHHHDGTHAHGTHGHQHVAGEHGHHHKVDDPQHGITSRLVGGPGDVNNLESMHLKPTM
ncbi:hypothetical protein EDD11_003814 [Mortierella claussenii]|nr:hypothetical protein EDD11_003814 [Mortierella claussenii]